MTVGWRRRIWISLPKPCNGQKPNTKGCCWDPGEYVFYLFSGESQESDNGIRFEFEISIDWTMEPDGMRRDDTMLWCWSGIRWKVCIVQRSRKIVRNFTETKSNPFFSMLYFAKWKRSCWTYSNSLPGDRPLSMGISFSSVRSYREWCLAPVFVHLIECK